MRFPLPTTGMCTVGSEIYSSFRGDNGSILRDLICHLEFQHRAKKSGENPQLDPPWIRPMRSGWLLVETTFTGSFRLANSAIVNFWNAVTAAAFTFDAWSLGNAVAVTQFFYAAF